MFTTTIDVASSTDAALEDGGDSNARFGPQHYRYKTSSIIESIALLSTHLPSASQIRKPLVKKQRRSLSSGVGRIRENKGRKGHKFAARKSCIPAIFLLMVADSLHLLPKLQFLEAFRMVRYSTKQYSRDTPSRGKKYRFQSPFFATQKQNASLQQQQKQPAPKDPFEATGQDDLFKTLAGGLPLIFEMAAKSMLFATKETGTKEPTNATAVFTNEERFRPPPPQQGRWYPHSGIADVNPNFRTQAPAMTNKGFAASIWKNARKRNKPSLWKHALRTYDRMALLESDPNFAQIHRSNVHHEGAMQACAKLGLWQRALEIYHYVYQEEMAESMSSPKTANNSNNRNDKNKKSTNIHVTDDMVMSLVRATVRASRLRSRKKRKSTDPPLSPEQEEQEVALRRIPLDTALEILSTLSEDHSIPLVAYYLNPLAAAYQSLGYTALSKEILETMLSNRTAGEDEVLNVNDLCAKDKGSYSLLVQASVVTGDWGSAVDALSEMTNAGIYPNSRHCNMWSEISERHTRPRAVGSWKKRRDDFWTESIR